MESNGKKLTATYRPDADEVFNIFKQLNQVPRPSWHEEKAAEFLCRFAEKNHLEYEKDQNNCVVIRKTATKGYENATPIVMLNHVDMVCVAVKGKTFDPLHDPIESYEDNGWLKAKGTSLGADNGMGLSMALAVLQDEKIVHGPIECVATTNEEDGMTGAANLSSDFIKGRKIINLDSEDYDSVTVGSAGAYLQFTTLPFTKETVPDGYSFFTLHIKGGLGGHSGVDINKGRANDNDFFVSNYSRSFVDEEVLQLGNKIKQLFDEAGAKTEVIMSAPAWQSDLSSPFLKLAEDTFVDVLHFMPRKVAMHFALEAGYYVRKFPGCEIVSIGPKIIEPHSVTERVDIHTIQNIWKVLIEMLARLANEKA